jgi:tRNA-specific 2-thiouridylase
MKIMVAMSGGVDSSAALLLLKREKKYELLGVTLNLYDNETANITTKTCCSLEDSKEAANVAARLEIPHYVYNFKDIFKQKVIDKFCDSYIKGETPNPCIDCNNYIKFNGQLPSVLWQVEQGIKNPF